MVALVALVSIALSLLNWSLCLVGGALLAREAGREAARRGIAVHYPLLCAAGYAGSRQRCRRTMSPSAPEVGIGRSSSTPGSTSKKPAFCTQSATVPSTVAYSVKP